MAKLVTPAETNPKILTGGLHAAIAYLQQKSRHHDPVQAVVVGQDHPNLFAQEGQSGLERSAGKKRTLRRGVIMKKSESHQKYHQRGLGHLKTRIRRLASGFTSDPQNTLPRARKTLPRKITAHMT